MEDSVWRVSCVTDIIFKTIDFIKRPLESSKKYNLQIIAVFATLAIASASPSGLLLGGHINPHALSPIGPSGIVTGHGASGPSGVVTGAGAAGPSGIVTGHGPIGPTGPAGHGHLLAAPVLAHAAPLALAAPAWGHGLALGHGLGLAHGVHGW
ncbi:hypothetical protein NQ318_007978 [Aromia moschata]|uniref:Uncharacterized protein n=1 Tax=Aromia moschata TaxID=1265417 RepID=A0AAV8YAD2_9CUCU|nr:hypothetical protein NQ318_007978 [Aromia moschata]